MAFQEPLEELFNQSKLPNGDRFIFQDVIAKTLQGRIIRSLDKETNKLVAIKETIKELVKKNESIYGMKIKENYLKEREIFIYLNNQFKNDINITKLIGFWEDDDNYYMAMEFCDECLFDYTVKHTSNLEHSNIRIASHRKKLWIQQVQNIFFQIVKAVSYMHDLNICHLDLSLENTLLLYCHDHDNSPLLPLVLIKIIDFGVANRFYLNNDDNDNNEDSFQYNCFRVGKEGYMSPEVRHQNNKPSYNAKSADIYSMGIMLFMLLIGAPPYKNADDAAAKYILNGQIKAVLQHWNRLTYVNNDALDLLNKMLCYEKNRITMEEIKLHPFVNFNEQQKIFESIHDPLPINIPNIEVVRSISQLDDEKQDNNNNNYNNEIKQHSQEIFNRFDRQTSNQSGVSSCLTISDTHSHNSNNDFHHQDSNYSNFSLNNSFISNHSSNTPTSKKQQQQQQQHYEIEMYDDHQIQKSHGFIIQESQEYSGSQASIKGLDEDEDEDEDNNNNNNNNNDHDYENELKPPRTNNNEEWMGFMKDKSKSKSKSKDDEQYNNSMYIQNSN